MRDDERSFLGPWLDGFERAFGRPPALAPLPPLDGVADLHALVLPDVFARPEETGHWGYFHHRPALVAHMRRLGVDWTETGRILTVPTPASLVAMLPRVAGTDGFRLAYHRDDASAISVARWLAAYLDGTILVHVASPEFYAGRRSTSELRWHCTALAHDLTVHALNYHLVPRAAIDELAAAIRSAIPDRVASWSTPGATAPLTLAQFYDYDLNRYAYEVWGRCERPSDYGPTFLRPGNYRQLRGALELRLEQTRAGKGDVPSQRTEDLPPLEAPSFRLEG